MENLAAPLVLLVPSCRQQKTFASWLRFSRLAIATEEVGISEAATQVIHSIVVPQLNRLCS